MVQIILEDLPLEERKRWLENRRKENEKNLILDQYKDGQIFKYRLTVEGYSHVQSIKSDFKITYIYELVYIEYNKADDLYRFSLTELSYKLDKYEDPIVAQIVEMSNEVSRIYHHLDLGVNRRGNIMKLYNRDEIRKRWEKTKEYLTYKHPLSSFEIIKIKERELANPQMEINNISFMHFLQVYFKQFGRFAEREIFDTMHMDQFGSGIPFGLKITFDMQPKKDGLTHRKMTGKMIYDSNVEKALCKIVKDSSAEIDYTTRADYYSNGPIIEVANFSYNQKIGEGYDMYSYLHLELIKDEQ